MDRKQYKGTFAATAPPTTVGIQQGTKDQGRHAPVSVHGGARTVHVIPAVRLRQQLPDELLKRAKVSQFEHQSLDAVGRVERHSHQFDDVQVPSTGLYESKGLIVEITAVR